jgi:protein SCO1/2
MEPMRTVRWVACGLAVVVAVAAGWVWVQHGGLSRLDIARIGVSTPGGVSVGGPFTLENAQGKTVTDADFRGRYMLVYFGYTFCPDVCPTELQMMITALGELGKDAARITPVFITIDPARDTPKVIGDYTALFSDRLVGLTGSEAQIAAAARAYRVYYAKAKSEQASSYLMDHSSFIYLMGPDGKLAALFGHDTTVKQLADGLRAKLAGTS